MRFIKNLYRSALVAVAGVLALASCQPEESPLARAIMTSVSGLQFAATGAEAQTITVYSDAEWTVEAPEWVTVDVINGNRTMDVTVTVGDNLRDGALDNPKKDTIVFKGYNLLAQAYVIVTQDGDKYRDVVPATISEVLSMKDEEVVVLDDVAVVALSSDGFVVNDGNESVFVSCTEPVTVGDCVDVWGSKGTMNGVPAVTICDDLKIERNFAVVYPLVNDITATIDTYAPSKLEYVELAGSLDGVNVLVEGATKVGALLAHSSVDLAALNGHNLIVRGFSFGATASLVNIIPVEIEDLGVNEIIYFTDNFDWLGEIALKEGAGDSVGTDDPEASAPNVFTMASADEFLSAFADQGYKFYWGTIGSSEFVEGPDPSKKDSRVMYIQRNYLKFGKTSWNGAITLPALSSIEGSANVVIEFDWCWQVTGSGKFKPDLMTLQIDATAGIFADSGTSTSVELESTQSTVEGESHLAWQHVKVILNGANSETVLMIRPTNADPDIQNPARHQNRWYLDNIKITDAGGAAPNPPAPKPETPLHAEWVFTADAMADAATGYAATFTGADKEAGDGGQYVNANVAGNGKISYVQIDKTTLDADGKAARTVGSSGHPYVTGIWPGDYWLFEATDGYAYPAGTSVSISYITRTSKTGHKYWRLEYIDGTEWKAAMPTTKYTLNGEEIEYNIAMENDGKTNVAVNTTVTLSAATKDIKFRMVCAGNGQSSDEAAIAAPNGGTCRIAGDDTGTSPVIKVLE